MTRRVVIVQPYVPTYRVPFFERLRQALTSQGVDCIVAAGVPRGDQAGRGDSIRPDWLIPIQQKTLTVGRRSFDFSIRPAPWQHTDAVILGLEGSSLPVYQALLSARRTGVRVGLWGHVRPYVAPGNPLDLRLEKRQMHVADHVFAYTPGGRDYALAAGVPTSKVTAVMNSVDTSTLEASRADVTEDELSAFTEQLGIDPNRTVCFVGGLDESKRVGFLADVLDQLWSRDPGVRLLVGGNGPKKSLLKPAFDRGQALDLGYLNTSEKAFVMTASKAIAMPGRIGLVAVDALVMRRPIITTDWAYHAPEAEYLVEGRSRFTSADNFRAYTELLLRTLESKENENDNAQWEFPTINQMVENFAEGVELMLTANSHGSTVGMKCQGVESDPKW
jgi:glycosyltransferase involved in cell wall biosynthesis